MTEKEAWLSVAKVGVNDPDVFFLCWNIEYLHISTQLKRQMHDRLRLFKPEVTSTCDKPWWNRYGDGVRSTRGRNQRVLACLFLAAMCD